MKPYIARTGKYALGKDAPFLRSKV